MKKKKKKTDQDKVVGAGLEWFLDWTDSIISEVSEEREAEMSSLAFGFTAWMRERAASAQEETTPNSESPDAKCFKHSSPAEGVQISPTMISVGYPEPALSVLLVLEGNARGVYTLLKDEALAEEPLHDGEVTNEALSYRRSGWPTARHSLTLFGARRIRADPRFVCQSIGLEPFADGCANT